MTIKHKFPAGKYYIGDPCYAVKNGNWSDVIRDTGCFGIEIDELMSDGKVFRWNDGKWIYRGKFCFASGTTYGDGSYSDNENREYGVDAGLIGIMPIEVCDGDSMSGGNIVVFDNEFEVWEHDGIFHFGNIIIDTKNDDENESGEDDDWNAEDDEDIE